MTTPNGARLGRREVCSANSRSLARSRGSLGGLIALLATCTVACGPSAEALERGRIVAAIEALRNAPAKDHSRRIGLADQLSHEAANTPEAIRARDACAKAYRLLAESNLAEAAAEKAIGTAEPGQAARGLAALDEAQKKLDASRSEMSTCSEANTALVLKK